VFQRGFKTWCERYSSEVRTELGLTPSAPLDPRVLAKHLGIRVWTPEDVRGLGQESLSILLRNDGETPSCWSAVTLVVGNTTLVIINSSHSRGRQSNDLMHELAHRIRQHKTHDMEVSAEGFMLLKAYGKEQEDEADWLAACLLLPRDALVSIMRRGLDPAEAAEQYGVSRRMLTYRLAMTGVNRQFA
jgi:Zn-dependent peptidase ImmA (M78 family)